METPTFRSPEKVIEDIQRLTEQGVKWIGLYQDLRMEGSRYWRELLTVFRKSRIDVERFSIDLFRPAEEEYIKMLSNTGVLVTLQIFPESGSYHVRKAHGRDYSNEDLLNTFKLCHIYGIPITAYFMIGLAQENKETIKETYNLWETLCQLDHKALLGNKFENEKQRDLVKGPVIGHMILLDPGSLAFDFLKKYGYKLTSKNLEDYINGLSAPSWHQWISYETELLNRDELAYLILESIEYAIHQREKHGIYSRQFAILELFQVKAHRAIMKEVERITNLQDMSKINFRLKSLKTALINILENFGNNQYSEDIYGYGKNMRQILYEAIRDLHFALNITTTYMMGFSVALELSEKQ